MFEKSRVQQFGAGDPATAVQGVVIRHRRSCATHRLPTGGAVRRPVSGASDTGAGSVREQAGAGPPVSPPGSTPMTPVPTRPLPFLRANARPAPGDPALNFCPSMTDSMVWAPVWARGCGARICRQLLGYSAERASSFLASRKVSVALYCVGWISVL